MERKNYLLSKLSKEEKSYLKKIAIYTRKEFLRKNRHFLNEENIEDIEEKLLISIENVEFNLEIKIENEIEAKKLEYIFSDENLIKIVKTLTQKEKLVLFLYYFENNTDLKIGKTLNIKGDTARKIRVRALEKIRNKYKNLKGCD